MKSSRRSFLQLFAFFGIGLGLSRCHAPGLSRLGTQNNAPSPSPVPTVEMQDIIMEGWSTLGSGFLGYNGALKTKYILENKTVTLPYTQDSHGHKFTLTPENFSDLRNGKSIDVLTTEKLGHKHIVRINPKKVDKKSVKVVMPIDIPSGDGQNP